MGTLTIKYRINKSLKSYAVKINPGKPEIILTDMSPIDLLQIGQM